MKPAVLRRSSAVMVPSAGAISAHIAMLALAKSLLLNLPTWVVVVACRSVRRAFSWSQRAMNGIPFVLSSGSQTARNGQSGGGAVHQPGQQLRSGEHAGRAGHGQVAPGEADVR